MEYIRNNFFELSLFLGIIVFYLATYIRVLVLYLKTGINHYSYSENRDKGLTTFLAVGILNLFFKSYTKYVGDFGALLGVNLIYIQYLGLSILVISILLLIASQSSLGSSWKIGLERERKVKLITSGLYKYSRHPIYVAMILFSLSVFLLFPSILTFIILIGNSYALIMTAKKEEAYLEEQFVSYKKYKEKVGFLLPKRHHPSI